MAAAERSSLTSFDVQQPSNEATPSDEARRLRHEFFVMSWCFSINHAAVTIPISFAFVMLPRSLANQQLSLLYGMTLISSMFVAAIAFQALGAKKGMVFSTAVYCVYVAGFAYASTLCTKHDEKENCVEGSALQAPIALLGGAVGGLGAGIVWTCQGALFSTICQRLAIAESAEPAAITASLGGTFGLIYLGCECAMRILMTVIPAGLGIPLSYMFCGYAAAAVGSSLAFAVTATELPSQTPAPPGSLCGKAMSVIGLWADPKLWLLQFTNLTFGMAVAWLTSFVIPNIVSAALGKQFLGVAGAVISGLASVLSKAFGPLSGKVGKGPVVFIGSMCFLAIGVLSKLYPDGKSWGYAAFIFCFLQGAGRAVFETTNKAIFADFFPGEKSPGAFANAMIFSTGASTGTFIMGFILPKEQVMELAFYGLVIFSCCTLPGYLVALAIKQRTA